MFEMTQRMHDSSDEMVMAPLLPRSPPRVLRAFPALSPRRHRDMGFVHETWLRRTSVNWPTWPLWVNKVSISQVRNDAQDAWFKRWYGHGASPPEDVPQRPQSISFSLAASPQAIIPPSFRHHSTIIAPSFAIIPPSFHHHSIIMSNDVKRC